MIVSILLLLLLSATAILWVRSYRASESLYYNAERETGDAKGSRDCLRVWLCSNTGLVILSVSTRRESGGTSYPPEPKWRYDADRPRRIPSAVRDPNAIVDHPHVYVSWRTVARNSPERWFHQRVSHGLLCLILLSIPAWYLVGAARRRMRRETWRCVECGYDLRATPGRCPECGTGVPEPPAFLLRRVRPTSMIACAIAVP